MPTFWMFSHISPPSFAQINLLPVCYGPQNLGAPFFMSGKRSHWTPCPLAYAMFPRVLFCTILSLECTPKHTALTLLGGETKLSSEGTEQNGVIHQCPGLFKQQLQWGSMTVNLGTLGWMPIVQKQRLHTITCKQRASSEPSRAYRGSDSS